MLTYEILNILKLRNSTFQLKKCEEIGKITVSGANLPFLYINITLNRQKDGYKIVIVHKNIVIQKIGWTNKKL